MEISVNLHNTGVALGDGVDALEQLLFQMHQARQASPRNSKERTAIRRATTQIENSVYWARLALLELPIKGENDAIKRIT